MFKPRMDLLKKVILFSIVIVRCAAAKGIEGLTIENKIEKGNLPDGYFVEQSSTEMIRKKIDEEVIWAFDCTEESMHGQCRNLLESAVRVQTRRW